MRKKPDISPLTIERLSVYLRALGEFSREGAIFVSSPTIAERIGTSPAQVRKDLSYFGSFGRKGRGYDIEKLIGGLTEIMGLNKNWKVGLVGFGKLGESLFNYAGFPKSGFHIVAIFDKDPAKIGSTREGVLIYNMDAITRTCEEKKILIAIVAVPPESAFEAIQRCLDAGIRAILNFSGQTGFKPPPHAYIKDINLAAEIESLSYFLTNR